MQSGIFQTVFVNDGVCRSRLFFQENKVLFCNDRQQATKNTTKGCCCSQNWSIVAIQLAKSVVFLLMRIVDPVGLLLLMTMCATHDFFFKTTTKNRDTVRWLPPDGFPDFNNKPFDALTRSIRIEPNGNICSKRYFYLKQKNNQQFNAQTSSFPVNIFALHSMSGRTATMTFYVNYWKKE